MTSISYASSVSVEKLPPSSSDNRTKSCESVCTSNSSCFFKRRKPMNPLAYSLRPTHHKTNTSTVKQRVMSAKMLKLRQLQSQLNDANFHLAEVARENQTLKTLQKRQDKALSKYENTNADLPRLLHAHEEERKVLTEKNKHLRKAVKELTDQLKQKEEELNKCREQLSHLEKLNKDKNLIEREKLMEKVEDLKMHAQRSNEQISTLSRKLFLETKISKQRLNSEIVARKQCQKELLHAFDEIDRLSGLLDAKENIVRPRNTKLDRFQNKGSTHMDIQQNCQGINRLLSHERLSTLKDSSQTPVTEVKLEPLVNENIKDLENLSKRINDGFKAPIENIKQRLSSGTKVMSPNRNGLPTLSSDIYSENSADNSKSRPNSSLKLLPVVEGNQKIRTKIKRKKESRSDENSLAKKVEENLSGDEKFDLGSDKISEKTRIEIKDEDQNNVDKKPKVINFDQELDQSQSGNGSDEDLITLIEKMKKEKQEETKSLQILQTNNRKHNDDNNVETKTEENIEKLAENLDAAIQRVAENSKEEFDKKIGNYCSEVMTSVKNCNKVIEMHKESLETSKKDTDNLMETLKRTEKVESKLKNSFFNMDDDMEFINEILNEEHKFQVENKVRRRPTLDKNSNLEKKSLVNIDNKKKLLATLRAIDNGDSVDSIEGPKQGTFGKERFGNVAH